MLPGNAALATAACLFAVVGVATCSLPHLSHVAFNCAAVASLTGFVNGVIQTRAQ